MSKHSKNTRTKKLARRNSAKARAEAFARLSDEQKAEQKAQNKALYDAQRIYPE